MEDKKFSISKIAGVTAALIASIAGVMQIYKDIQPEEEKVIKVKLVPNPAEKNLQKPLSQPSQATQLDSSAKQQKDVVLNAPLQPSQTSQTRLVPQDKDIQAQTSNESKEHTKSIKSFIFQGNG